MECRLTPGQIRGARGMLDWSRLDLARVAGLSVSTVKRAEEAALPAVSAEIHQLIRRALEAEGLTFLDEGGEGPGLRLKAR